MSDNDDTYGHDVNFEASPSPSPKKWADYSDGDDDDNNDDSEWTQVNTTKKRCKNCGAHGHFTRKCPKSVAQTCERCGTRGHTRHTCKERICRLCNDKGHLARACPNLGDNRMRCYKCGHQGHKASACERPPVCYYCKKNGHMRRECPCLVENDF